MAIALMTAVWKLEIAATEKMVMLALADWANEQAQCWPSMAQLAKKSGLTDRSLRAIVGRLVEARLLTRVENIGKGVFYTIHPGTCCPPETASPRNETSRTPEAASANTSVTIITSEAKASSVVRRRASRFSQAEMDRGFRAFWAAYPKRVAKDAASKAFSKAMDRITEDDPLSVILAGIERALPGWEDAQFIPHPTTWLNQGRWEDEAPSPRTGLTRNAKPDQQTARLDNFRAAWTGADGAAEMLAARRTF